MMRESTANAAFSGDVLSHRGLLHYVFRRLCSRKICMRTLCLSNTDVEILRARVGLVNSARAERKNALHASASGVDTNPAMGTPVE